MSAKRDVGLYLDDILESIERIERSMKGLSKAAFDKNDVIQDAVIHRLEIIGEAIKNIPQEFHTKHPDVPWREIARTRDKIIHHYFEVDMEQIWSITKKDLKSLKDQVQKMVNDLDSH